MSKVRPVEAEVQRKRKQPPAGAEVVIAADISSTKWVYAVRWDGEERYRFSSPADLEHTQALVQRYTGHSIRFAYEACGFGYQAAWMLQELGVEVRVVAPSKIERAPGRQVKTDLNDVGRMARKLEMGDLKGIYIPTRTEHERRQLVRSYGQAVKERKRAQTRIRSLMHEHGRSGPRPKQGWPVYRQWLERQELPDAVQLATDSLLEMRAVADRHAKLLEKKMLELANHTDYRHIVSALCTQAGVGTLSAIRFILEIGDIGRFRTAKSIGHYLGLTPSEYSSGEVLDRGPILKCGPGTLRAAMLQCGWASTRSPKDPTLKNAFEQLSARMGKKRAIVAVTRRLVTRLRAKWIEVLDQHDVVQTNV